jgi:RES domain-containing protein
VKDGGDSPGTAGRVAYRGAAAVAIDGTEPWNADRLIDTEGGRWSRPGQPTIYLAGDPGVALAEFARHCSADGGAPEGSLWTIRVALDDVSDLRQADDATVLDRDRCRALADELRGAGVEGILVPSVAFLDRRDRFNVVLFAEIVGARLTEVTRAPALLARLAPT